MNVLIIGRISPQQIAAISEIDPSIEVTDAFELFGPELAAEWPEQTVRDHLPARLRDLEDSPEKQRRRDELLRNADVVAVSMPFPRRLVSRAPRLRFVHQNAAGVSNLVTGDIWKSHVAVTSGRGRGNTLPIAEWSIGAIFALSKEFPRAMAQAAAGEFDRSTFQGRQVAGTTVGIIGVGGIGQHVARLGEAVGMRVIGMRRSSEQVPHVERLYTPDQLHAMLAECDHVVVAAQSTDETFHMLDAEAIAAMKPGSFIINVARGELIDESALIPALHSGQIGGFAGDVYEGEFDHEPPAALLEAPNVILTPHTSGHSHQRSSGPMEVLRENIRRSMAGEPLINQVDWERGY